MVKMALVRTTVFALAVLAGFTAGRVSAQEFGLNDTSAALAAGDTAPGASALTVSTLSTTSFGLVQDMQGGASRPVPGASASRSASPDLAGIGGAAGAAMAMAVSSGATGPADAVTQSLLASPLSAGASAEAR
jgi:hypothetical protein